jgi:hypothetical protein
VRKLTPRQRSSARIRSLRGAFEFWLQKFSALRFFLQQLSILARGQRFGSVFDSPTCRSFPRKAAFSCFSIVEADRSDQPAASRALGTFALVFYVKTAFTRIHAFLHLCSDHT